MIRQLEHRCWYFDSDPWEEVHYATEATAVVDEAELAASCERGPRPARRHPAPCWVAECDRCRRPAGDEDECGLAGHQGSEATLLAVLISEEWVLGEEGRVSCPDRPVVEVERVPVTTCWAGGLTGEVTACPELVIVPRRTPEGVWLGVVLAHAPTGRYIIPSLGGETVGLLHRMAELLTGLDWSSPQLEQYASGYDQPVLAAYYQASEEYHGAAAGRAGWSGAR